jgi:F-type H+-transporting ATPase subunit b
MIAAVPAAEESNDFWASAYPIIPHPGELIFGIIAIAILYWVFAKYVVPRLEAIFAERTAAIEGGIAKAEIAQREANDAKQQLEAELAQARNEAARIREEARAEAAQIGAELRARAQEDAARITAAAQQQLQAERQQTLVQLRSEVGRLAVDLASRIVQESLADDDRQRRVVDRFLAELESQDGAGDGAADGSVRRSGATAVQERGV